MEQVEQRDKGWRSAIAGLLGDDPVAAALLVIVALFAAWNALGFWRVTIDDAWISLVYARNLVEGNGLAWFPGERVEGYSNPPWVMVMALGLALGLPGMVGAKLAGLLSHVAAIVGAAGLARELVRPRGRTAQLAVVFGVALLAVSLPATWWAARGLETASYGALLVLASWRLAVELRRPDARPWSALLAALAALSRPEAPLAVLPLVAARTAAGLGRERRAALARWLAIFAVPTVGWLAFRLLYYGRLFANTYYQKGHAEGPTVALQYLEAWLRLEWPLLVLGAAGLLVLSVAIPRRTWPVALLVCGQLAFLLTIGRDWMPNHRFVVPLLPFLATGVAGLGALLATRLQSSNLRFLVISAVAVVAAAQTWLSLPLEEAKTSDGTLVRTARQSTDWFPASLDRPTNGMSIVPTWLMERAAPGATVAFTDIGVIGWSTDFRIIDLSGLTNDVWSGATGLDLDGQAAWLGQQLPDWIVLKEPPITRFKAITSSPWLVAEYEIEQGPRNTLAARRRGVPLATDAEILAAYEQAVQRLPHHGRYLWRRAIWAKAVGTPEQQTAACEDIREQLPFDPDMLTQCTELMGKPTRRPPSRKPEPLSLALGRFLAPAPEPPAEQPGGEDGEAVEEAATEVGEGTPVPLPEDLKNPFARKGGHGLGMGWIPFPVKPDPRLSREKHALRVEAGAADSEPVQVCTAIKTVQGPVRIVGQWRYKGVVPTKDGDPMAGVHVFLTPRSADGKRLRPRPKGPAKFTVVAGRGNAVEWSRIDETVTLPAAAVDTRLCVEVTEGKGTAWFKELNIISGAADDEAEEAEEELDDEPEDAP